MTIKVINIVTVIVTVINIVTVIVTVINIVTVMTNSQFKSYAEWINQCFPLGWVSAILVQQLQPPYTKHKGS